MKYDILTDTAFFRAAQNGSTDEMTASYGEFIEKVVEVCSCTDGKPLAVVTLSYTEIELKALMNGEAKGNELIAKAAALVEEAQRMVRVCQNDF